jgi:hypothetical protein
MAEHRSRRPGRGRRAPAAPESEAEVHERLEAQGYVE